MQTKKIFLASSAELVDDRRQFETLLNRKNKQWIDEGVFLELIIWEDFLDALSQTRLQDEYNRAIRGCDLFVLLFSTKVGTYTAEEFETAFGTFKASNRPLIYTYFKDAPISTGTADKNDLMSLWAFQDRLKALGHFHTVYRNVDALTLHFTDQLEKLVRNGSIELGKNAASIEEQKLSQRVRRYLSWVQARTQTIELRGIERAGGAPIVLLPLETAYVPLRARSMNGFDDRLRDIELSEVLGLGNRLVIVGGPGSGKTTVLKHVAWALATSLLTGQREPARSRLGANLDSAPGKLPLPIDVPLASYARYRRNLRRDAPASEKTLAHFISHHLIEKQADFDLPGDFLAQLLEDGRDVVLLLDGLDEVANEDERAEVRQSVEDLVSGREQLLVMVTCRTIAYRTGRTALGAHFREIAVQPLDFKEHITPMVKQAYACIYPNNLKLRIERTQDLLLGIEKLEEDRRVRLGEQVGQLVDSPLMVRLLLIVHVNNRKLPDERADLFDKAVNTLLQVDYGREESDNNELAKDWKPFRDMAQHLAFYMHELGSNQGREIEEPALRAALAEDADFKPRIEGFVIHARQRGSVVEEVAGAFRFLHLAFQEFLVARHLREVVGAGGHEAMLSFLEDRLEDPWWREPILLLAGYLAANTAKSARDFLSALARAGSTPSQQFSAVELAATAAMEWQDSGDGIRRQCALRIQNLLGSDHGESPGVVRGRAADSLAQLGDPRFDPDVFYLPCDDDLGFVHVLADPDFRIGTRAQDMKHTATIVRDDGHDNESNDALTPTQEFYIARYPVTVAQFAAFADATGFKIRNADALRDRPSWPVRWVSWYEAMAYCEWLNEMLASSQLLADRAISSLVRDRGWQVCLPSELEWEVAARGGLRGTVFPWGDEPDPKRANFADSHVGRTTIVGAFPANGFGLYDMIGNVWEWTRSVYEAYPYDPSDPNREDLKAGDEVNRVVRGGAFNDSGDGARCAFRFRHQPVYSFYCVGFRLVLRSSARS